MRKYIHPFERDLEGEIKRLENSSLAEANKQLITSFYEHNLAQGFSLARLIRQMCVLRRTAGQVKKDFREASKEDYEQFLIWLHKQGCKEATIWTYKKILKVFHKWLNNGTYPECVAWFKFKKIGNQTLPEQLLTQEDAKQLIKSALNQRDKALIASLWETGARIGELGSARIRDISFDEFGGRILLDGKTGMRKVRIVHSAPYVLEWINKHPYSKNIDAPLWICLEKSHCEQMGYSAISKVLRTAKKRASLQKPINPHHFRHSRATYMAQFLTDAQMKEYFGWGQDSKMAARYVHLSGKQVDDAVLRMCGLKKGEEQKDLLKREPCPRCKQLNDVNNDYCEKCWLPLSPQASREMRETEENSQESVISLMKLLELAGNNPQKIRQALTILQQGLPGGV
ncbi:MAG: tyrosine-type recombinase/integrase [Candidatus Diapherotrites archaeon]|uniref:Tyrosine-type recombinase/integrase n=1 Tax=Candidatus Iainarchaeum sp. TaxID=3101447 RepID=A0A938YT15_9ARCH|nr:tyrosine-type recombinase/integrase [Candidatus Diapherotrites archaeon]